MQNFAKRSLTGANIFALKKKYVCGSISCQQKPSQCFRTKKTYCLQSVLSSIDRTKEKEKRETPKLQIMLSNTFVPELS